MYHQYMCILPYVKVIWYNSYSIDILSIGVGGTCILSICASFLYVKFIWCNMILHRYLLSIGVRGVDVSSVYVHSAICETYLV